MGKFHEALHELAAWFERQKRVLPWRDRPELYRVWVSEIMLQQTQVATVIPYFERFLAHFPTVEDLAAASEDEVTLQWAGLGYYLRARNLHRGARKIVAEGFPRDREGWEGVPGVGPYTAGAILSIALDQPEAILDGNVERVMSRLRRVNRRGGDAAFKARLWGLSRIFVERGFRKSLRPSVINQALMELGATICTPKKPRCPLCPVRGVCRAFQAGDAEAYPPGKKPKQWLQVREELHCLLDPEGRVLLAKRQAGEWRAGLWDFLSEAPARAEKIGSVETRHVVTRHKVTRVTHVWKATARWKAAESCADRADLPRWVRMEEPEVAVGSAAKRAWSRIRETFPEA